jgi:hypothetical protein
MDIEYLQAEKLNYVKKNIGLVTFIGGFAPKIGFFGKTM